MKKITLIILCIIIMSVPVFANSMAPTSIPGKAGIFVDKESGIKLLDETLTITISDDLENTSYSAHYSFQNLNAYNIETPIWFLTRGYLNSHEVTVFIDGQKVKSKAVEAELNNIENWNIEEQDEYYDPYTGKVIDTHNNRYAGDNLSAYEFLLNMEHDQVIDIVVNYKVWNGYISPRITDYIFDVKLTSYMLSPAAFYEGDETIDIKVIAPTGISLKSNLELDKTSVTEYEVNDYQLKDNENLYLSFSKRPGLTELFARDRIGFTYRLVAIQLLLFIGFFVNKKSPVRNTFKWLLVISLAGFLRTAGYGVFYLLPLLSVVAVVLYLFLNKMSPVKE